MISMNDIHGLSMDIHGSSMDDPEGGGGSIFRHFSKIGGKFQGNFGELWGQSMRILSRISDEHAKLF